MKLFLAMMLAMGAGAILVAPATKAVKGAAQKTESAVKTTVDHTEALITDRIEHWTESVAAGWTELQEKLLASHSPDPAPTRGADEAVVPPPPLVEPWSFPRRPLYAPWSFSNRSVPRRPRPNWR